MKKIYTRTLAVTALYIYLHLAVSALFTFAI